MAAVTRADEHRFFTGPSLAILGLAVAGFSRTYLLVPWLGLPQGSAAIPAAPAPARVRGLRVVRAVPGAGVARGVGSHAAAPPARPGRGCELAFLAVSIGNIVAYTMLSGAALLWRRRPAVHKRLMMLGMVVLLTAPFGRILSFPYHLEHVVGPGLVVAALA